MQSTELSSTAVGVVVRCEGAYVPLKKNTLAGSARPSRESPLPVHLDLVNAAQQEFTWKYRFDQQDRYYVVGSSSYSVGLHEFYMKTPLRLTEAEQFFVLMDYFSERGFNDLTAGKIGFTVQFDANNLVFRPQLQSNYYLLQGSLAQASKQPLFQRAFSDYLQFLKQGYGSRMNIGEADLQQLESISMQLADRSYFFFRAQESMFDFMADYNRVEYKLSREEIQKQGGKPEHFPGQILPETFRFQGGAVMVESRHSGELLPLEMFTGERVPRLKKSTVELGRMFVDKEADPETSVHVMGLMVAVAHGLGRVDQVVIEADFRRAKLFGPLGFDVFKERVNFAGEKEYIFTAPVERVLAGVQSLLQRKLKSLNEPLGELSRVYNLITPGSAKLSLNLKDPRSAVSVVGSSDPLDGIFSIVFRLSQNNLSVEAKREILKLNLRQHYVLAGRDSKKLDEVIEILVRAQALDRNSLYRLLQQETIRLFGEREAELVFPMMRIPRFFAEVDTARPYRTLSDRLKLLERIRQEKYIWESLGEDWGAYAFIRALNDPRNSQAAALSIAKHFREENIMGRIQPVMMYKHLPLSLRDEVMLR
jgi:hypothetical protein